MRKAEFYKWFKTQKRVWRGKKDYYSENAIQSRIRCLEKLEYTFKIDLDNKVKSYDCACDFLREIREKNIEDLKHTPLSNAFRHYFEFAQGYKIDKIF